MRAEAGQQMLMDACVRSAKVDRCPSTSSWVVRPVGVQLLVSKETVGPQVLGGRKWQGDVSSPPPHFLEQSG